MSKKILTSIDMNQNQILNAVMQPLATSPSNPVLGQYYYNSSSKKMFQWNGAAWVTNGVTYTLSLGTVSATGVEIKLTGDDGSESKATLPLATTALAGLMAPAQVTKLNGIATGANKYTHPAHDEFANALYKITVDSLGHVIEATVVKKSDITGLGIPAQDTVYTHPTSDGNKHVPATGTTNNGKVLKAGSTAGSFAWSALSKSDVGLGKVDNTSDMEKPVSTAQQQAIQANYEQMQMYVQDEILAVEELINNLPAEQFLDLSKTVFVDSFTWSSTTYPNSTNPNLNGKPVLVLALKDEDGNVSYSFLNMYDLVETYTGTTPIVVTGTKITHADSGATAGNYGNSVNQTPAFAGTFNVPYITVDAKGHVTAISNKTVKIPNTVATTSAAGLMSADDKKALNDAKYLEYLTITMEAGSVMESGTGYNILGYTACDAVTGEELMVEFSQSDGAYSWIIDSEYQNDIEIRAIARAM